jgi:hypothetical protein
MQSLYLTVYLRFIAIYEIARYYYWPRNLYTFTIAEYLFELMLAIIGVYLSYLYFNQPKVENKMEE